jgi:predicted CopG family antitoxin
METITIPKQEYKKLKKLEEIDMELLSELVQGLKDIKEGRIKPWD